MKLIRVCREMNFGDLHGEVLAEVGHHDLLRRSGGARGARPTASHPGPNRRGG